MNVPAGEPSREHYEVNNHQVHARVFFHQEKKTEDVRWASPRTRKAIRFQLGDRASGGAQLNGRRFQLCCHALLFLM
jgi:hypothetical protein